MHTAVISTPHPHGGPPGQAVGQPEVGGVLQGPQQREERWEDRALEGLPLHTPPLSDMELLQHSSEWRLREGWREGGREGR